VNYLLKARKFIHSLIRDTTDNPDAHFLRLSIECDGWISQMMILHLDLGMSMTTDILTTYLNAQKQLIEFEDIDKTNCLVSLPRHFSAHTRVEIAITRLSQNQFALTDQRQTLGELKDAGVPVGSRLLDRVKEIIRIWKKDLVGITLVPHV
jgi:hypothetical protein